MKYAVAFLFIIHGLAHVTGILGAWASGEQGFQDEAWIFSRGITARSVVGQAWSLLWLVALIGFVGAGIGLLLGSGAESTPWWPTLAIAAAAVSLAAIVPWVRVVPPGAWAGALLDLIILVALLPPWSDQIVAALR
jgi:hypothetical protein